MTADTAADTSSNLTITNAAYRTISINGGNADKGVLINGAQGKTVTVDTVAVTSAAGDLITSKVTPSATVAGSSSALSSTTEISNQYFTVTPTASKNQNGWLSGTISNGTVKNFKIKDGSFSSASVSGNKVTVSVGTSGWFDTSDKVETTIPMLDLDDKDKDAIFSLEGDAYANGDYDSYKPFEVAVPSKGYLCLTAGYYPATVISLDSILGGSADTGVTAISSGYLRNGYKAYNVDGEEITGTMSDLSLSDTYYTTTNTGFGVVTAGKYVATTKYIKAGAYSVSVGNDSYTPTISKITTDGKKPV